LIFAGRVYTSEQIIAAASSEAARLLMFGGSKALDVVVAEKPSIVRNCERQTLTLKLIVLEDDRYVKT